MQMRNRGDCKILGDVAFELRDEPRLAKAQAAVEGAVQRRLPGAVRVLISNPCENPNFVTILAASVDDAQITIAANPARNHRVERNFRPLDIQSGSRADEENEGKQAREHDHGSVKKDSHYSTIGRKSAEYQCRL